MKPVYGNVVAVREPDPRVRATLKARLKAWWPDATILEPAAEWLMALRDVGPAGMVGQATEHAWTVGFAEDSTATLATEGIISLAVGTGDVTAIGVRADGHARAVRSAAGTVPVYVGRDGDRVGISTLAEGIVRVVLRDPTFDPLGLAPWMLGLGIFPDGRTWYRGMEALQPGTSAEIGAPGIVRRHRWFDPRPARIPRPTRLMRVDHAKRLGELVLHNLQRTLDPDGGNLLTLSGGADSATLAFLTAGTLGHPLMTLSILSSHPAERERDLASIGSFAAAHPPKRQWFEESTTEARLAALQAADPVCIPLLHPALHHLPTLCRQEDITVLFGGEWADEVAGARPQIRDWIEQTSPFGLARSLTRLPNGPRDVPRWLKWRMLRSRPYPMMPADAIPDFLSPQIAEEYAEWRQRVEAALRVDRRPWRHLAVRFASLEATTAMNWEAASARRVLRAYPFLSRETIELVYRCHPSELMGPGYKRLLIGAFHGTVPMSHLTLDKRTGMPATPAEVPAEVAPVRLDLVMLGVLARLSAATQGASATIIQGKSPVSGRRRGRT